MLIIAHNSQEKFKKLMDLLNKIGKLFNTAKSIKYTFKLFDAKKLHSRTNMRIADKIIKFMNYLLNEV
jgi:hypothetical protein